MCWELRVLAIGPPRKSLTYWFYIFCFDAPRVLRCLLTSQNDKIQGWKEPSETPPSVCRIANKGLKDVSPGSSLNGAPFLMQLGSLTVALFGSHGNYLGTRAYAQSFRHVRLFATPWTPPDSMEFSRQEYRSRLTFLLQWIFPAQGLNLCLLCPLHWQARSLPLCKLGSPAYTLELPKWSFFITIIKGNLGHPCEFT